MQNSDFPNLPRSWQVKTLKEIMSVKDGTHESPKYLSKGYPFVTSKNLKNNTISFDNIKYISKQDYDKFNERSKVEIGDVLFAMIGTIGNPVVITQEVNFAIKNVALFKKSNFVLPMFLKYYLETSFVMSKMQKESRGSTQKFVSLEYLRNFKIPIPSLEIQKRIVKRLDEAFARIENGTKHLQSAKDNLTKYKQSLLKSAFNGTLTNESIKSTHPLAPSAREGEQEKCNPQSEIGQIIEWERKDCHALKSPLPQHDGHLGVGSTRNDENSPSLAEGARGWVNPLNNNALDCHADKSARNDDKDSLNGESANLPQSWVIKTLGEIAFVTKLAGFEYTKYIYPNLVNSGIPLFKGKNIQSNKLVLEFESYIPKNISNQLERSKLSKKCILTPYVGSIGNVAIFDGSFEAHLGSNVGKIEILNNYALEEYVFYFLQSSVGYLELTKHKKATAQESISISAIRDVKIPIPPLETQKQIVAILEKHFTSADKVSAYIDSCLTKAKQLKSSLLKSAFEGELV